MDWKLRQLLRGYFVEKQAGRCCYCRRAFADDPKLKPTLEHRKRVADGGTDDPKNLAAACWHCNQHRGTQMNRARQLKRAATPPDDTGAPQLSR